MSERATHNDDECRLAFARRILVPSDFSEASRAALAYAVSLVESCDATLHVVHVLKEIVGAEPLEWPFGARSAIERAIEHSAMDDLRQLLSHHERPRMRVRLAVRWGMPTIEILRYARTEGVDLIAMGRDGRGGFKHMLLGSVADTVMRNAPCAVLSVRYPVLPTHQRHHQTSHIVSQ